MVNPVHQGVALGLLLGKPIGIFISCLIIVKIGMAQLPRSVDWPDIFGVGLLGGIGFTMALFISGLALPPDLEVFSKTGILIGSLMSAVAGSITLSFVLNRPRGT
jgi:NhaA family Na+:H+ antiporter